MSVIYFLFFDGAAGFPSQPTPGPGTPATPPKFYDIYEAMFEALPGVVITRNMETAVVQAFDAGGQQPMTVAAIQALALPFMPIDGNPPPLSGPGATPSFTPTLPVFPTLLPRFADSNPDPMDDWSIDVEGEGPAWP